MKAPDLEECMVYTSCLLGPGGFSSAVVLVAGWFPVWADT